MVAHLVCSCCAQEESEGAAASAGAVADDGRKYADYSYELLLQRVSDIITSKVRVTSRVGCRLIGVGYWVGLIALNHGSLAVFLCAVESLLSQGVLTLTPSRLFLFFQSLIHLSTLLIQIQQQQNPELTEKKRTTMKPPMLMRIGTKKTLWANFADICGSMKRNPEHVRQFFEAELGTESRYVCVSIYDMLHCRCDDGFEVEGIF
jgi:hypothetical protein